MTPYQRHQRKWLECKRCKLCENRTKVCLIRGKIPCDVLFIGEAPGASEDIIGAPFVGPAGRLLDNMIEAASDPGNPLRVGMANLLGCIPTDERGDKIVNGKDIPREYIKTCAERVSEIVKLCKPAAIVLVGKLAKAEISGQAQFGACSWIDFIRFAEIDHPAFILRLDLSQKPLAIQRNTIVLRDLFEEVCVFSTTEQLRKTDD